jgi:hypothetical protein
LSAHHIKISGTSLSQLFGSLLGGDKSMQTAILLAVKLCEPLLVVERETFLYENIWK